MPVRLWVDATYQKIRENGRIVLMTLAVVPGERPHKARPSPWA
jgi:hypothetical protein